MTFDEIKTEVRARGYDYVTPSRIDLWIKQTYEWVCGLEPWPFLETSITGPAPFTLTDLSQILSVGDTQGPIRGEDIRDILDRDPTLAAVGTPPVNWYLDGNTINVWPASSENIAVRYIRTPPAPVPNVEPLVPAAYQEIIVDGAVLRGLKDNDEYDTAAGLQNVIDMNVAGMKEALLVRDYQGPQSQIQTGYAQDYSA